MASLLCSALPRRGFAIREASTTLGSMLGMSASEMTGLDVVSLFPSAPREGMLQALTAAIKLLRLALERRVGLQLFVQAPTKAWP